MNLFIWNTSTADLWIRVRASVVITRPASCCRHICWVPKPSPMGCNVPRPLLWRWDVGNIWEKSIGYEYFIAFVIWQLDLRTAWPWSYGLIPGRGEEILLLCKMCRPFLGSIYPPFEWVPGVMWLGMKLSLISNLVHILSVATLGHYAFFISAHAVSVYGISLYCCVPRQSTCWYWSNT